VPFGYRDLNQDGMMRAYYDADGADSLLSGGRASETIPSDHRRFERMKKFALLALLATLLVSAGCVYRANISQGNLIKQDDLDKVEVGMTRSQVRFLLGTPMIDDPFHADRWDYVYYLKIGRNDAGFKRWVSVFFTDDKVSEIRKEQELAPDL
jgi:outer membrane protein assembly factor BamE